MSIGQTSHSSYLGRIFESDQQLHMTIRHAKKLIKQFIADGNDFDAIVCRGVSGVTVGSILSYLFKKQLVVVRKGEKSHASTQVEGLPREGLMKFIIVDDFICSGETFKEIAVELDKAARGPSLRFVGSLLYSYEKGVVSREDTIARMDYIYREQFEVRV